MRIVFAGTPDIAADILTALLSTDHDIVAVYTQPDKPAGRGQHLQASPVKQVALQHDITVEQPQRLRSPEAQATLRQYQPDLMVVSAYGLLLPQAVLDIPKYGCWNVHYSLLPRWRGATPIQRPIEAGDAVTGVTIIQMDAGLDTGDILYTKECPIGLHDTGGSMHKRLSTLGQQALLETLEQFEQNNLTPISQDESLATYAPKFSKAESHIDWQESSEYLSRKIRAFTPWPGIYSFIEGERIRIHQADITGKAAQAAPGTITYVGDEGIDVATGHGTLRLQVLQFAGGKPLAVKQCRHGHAQQLTVGAQFR